MTLRGAAIQGGLALVALAMAYSVSQRPVLQQTGDVKVLDLGKDAAEKVRYDSGTAWGELARTQENGEDQAWLLTSSRVLPAKPVPDGGVAEAPVTLPERHLRGNKSALEVLTRLSPLYATRALGVLPEAKLKELKLDASPKKLTVLAAGKSYGFTVSTSAMAGAPYLRRDSDGAVFLLGGTLVSDLDSAAESPTPGGRLLDRQLHTFKVEPGDLIAVAGRGKSRQFVAIQGDVPNTYKLAPKGQITPDLMAKNWHDKLWRLPSMEVLGKDENPAAGMPRDDLRVTYGRGSKELGYFQLGRLNRDVYGRTEHSAGWLKLPPSAEELILEVEKIASPSP